MYCLFTKKVVQMTWKFNMPKNVQISMWSVSLSYFMNIQGFFTIQSGLNRFEQVLLLIWKISLIYCVWKHFSECSAKQVMFGINFHEDGFQITLKGSSELFNYERILKEIHYFNAKPAFYLNRVFQLQCSNFQGKWMDEVYRQYVSMYLIRYYTRKSVSKHSK